MNDRTTVTLHLLLSQLEAATEIMGQVEPSEQESHDGIATLTFYEVNYGNLDFLPDLRDAGIAYDSRWDAGSEYGEGVESLRFTSEGLAILNTLYVADDNPPIHKLLEHINAPSSLRQYILDYQDMRSVLPLDASQEAYGRLYRTRELVGFPTVPA
jgi:hypothetical protein